MSSSSGSMTTRLQTRKRTETPRAENPHEDDEAPLPKRHHQSVISEEVEDFEIAEESEDPEEILDIQDRELMELFDQVGLDADTVRRLLESKIDSSSLFFALTEQELKTEFLIPFHALVKFRLARHQFELSSMVQLSAGLLGALPEFKGRGNRALVLGTTFFIRL